MLMKKMVILTKKKVILTTYASDDGDEEERSFGNRDDEAFVALFFCCCCRRCCFYSHRRRCCRPRRWRRYPCSKVLASRCSRGAALSLSKGQARGWVRLHVVLQLRLASSTCITCPSNKAEEPELEKSSEWSLMLSMTQRFAATA